MTNSYRIVVFTYIRALFSLLLHIHAVQSDLKIQKSKLFLGRYVTVFYSQCETGYKLAQLPTYYKLAINSRFSKEPNRTEEVLVVDDKQVK
jgi:hypothetical protein